MLLPYVGVPLYLLIGGRKLRRIARQKTRVLPALPAGFPEFGERTTCAAGRHGGRGRRRPAAGAGKQGPPPRYRRRGIRLLGEQIRRPGTRIHITAFILGRDETGRRIVNLLAERAREGVKVRLSSTRSAALAQGDGLWSPSARAGRRGRPVHAGDSVHVPRIGQPEKPPEVGDLRPCQGDDRGAQPRPRVHGERTLSQTMGDLGAAIEGPAAALLNEVFIADWCFATRQAPETPARGVLVPAG